MPTPETLLSVRDIKDILRPNKTPEMGFESFRMLEGDGVKREQTQADFLSGKIVNPDLDYPRLDETGLDQGIRNLQHILTLADGLKGDTKNAVWNSAAYRMAEMYWLKSLIYLQDVTQRGDEDQIQSAAEQHQCLNEALYGKPDSEEGQRVMGEIFAQTHQKLKLPTIQKLEDDLMTGFPLETGGYCPAVLDSGNQRLPAIQAKPLKKLRTIIEQQFTGDIAAFDGYYQTSVSQRPEAEQVYTAMDCLVIFNLISSRHQHKFDVILDNDAAAMSWDIERQAIIVGGRHPNMKNKESVLAKIVHEYGVHAHRSITGIESPLPTLGTGLYIQPENGENPDYLTFEEGFASICEFALKEDKTVWEIKDLEKTTAINLAYRGFDFRQTFEALYRLRCLMIAKDGEAFKPESIDRAKRNSYKTVERIFRGTPTSLPREDKSGRPRVLTYNKDLAYLSGKLKALDFIDKADDTMIRMAFKGKFDPTVPQQLALAQKYIV